MTTRYLPRVTVGKPAAFTGVWLGWMRRPPAQDPDDARLRFPSPIGLNPVVDSP